MRTPVILAAAALWAASLFAAAGVARLMAEEPEAPAQLLEGRPAMAGLETERAALAERLASLQAERNRLFMKLEERREAAAEETDGAGEPAPALERSSLPAYVNGVPRAEVEAVLERNRRFLDNLDELRGAPLDGIAQALGALYDVGRIGGPAIEQLADYLEAHPDAVDLDGPGMAVIFGLMAYPHERSIETMTTFMEEDGLDGDLLGMWAYRQLSALPSNEVAPRAETFRARAREQREAGRFGTDSALPLAALAFAHGDREAESMLAPAQLRERDAAGVIAAADHIHTSEARQWLERVAREHNAPEVRAQADAALARWREGM